MKRTFFSFFIFVYVLSTVAQSLSIGQYNIRFDKKQDREEGNGWDVRAPKIYSLINYKGWDIFGAQEVLYNQINDLKANIEGYDYIGVGRDDGAKKGEFAPIFYKKERLRCIKNGNFWLSETPDSVGSRGWDVLHFAVYALGENLRTRAANGIFLHLIFTWTT